MKLKREKRQRTKGKGGSRKKKVWIIGVIVGIAGLSVVGGLIFGGNEETAAAKSSTVKVTKTTVQNTLSFDGEISSALEESLAPHTSYYLEEVLVEEGAAVAEGEAILSYTNGNTMDAPYDCVVKTLTLPDAEEQLTTEHSVTIASTTEMQMTLSVEEGDVNQLTLGDEATITATAVKNTYTGYVTYIGEVGTYASGGSTFTAKVNFKNDGALMIGMSGTAEIVLEEASDVLAVPVDAVQYNGGQSYVVVVSDDGSTENVDVETGISSDSFTEIKSGLNEGQTVQIVVDEDEENSAMGGMGGMGEMPAGGDMPEMPSGGGNMPSGGGAPPSQ